MDKILLFIPAYNCEKQITRVLDKVKKYDDFFESIILVDNISTDNTFEVLKELQIHLSNKYIIIRNKENYGLGGSHKVAFDYAIKNNFDYVVVLHGDDQADIEDIIPILESKEYLNYDSMLGARFMKDSVLEGYSKFRTFGNKVYNMLFSAALRKEIYDLGSGLNMYDVNILKSKYYEKYPDNLLYNYCMVFAIDYYMQNVKFFSISWREEDQKSNVKMLSQSTKVLALLWKYTFFNKEYFMKKEFRENVRNEYLYEEIKRGD